jgi:hypothetical protein
MKSWARNYLHLYINDAWTRNVYIHATDADIMLHQFQWESQLKQLMLVIIGSLVQIVPRILTILSFLMIFSNPSMQRLGQYTKLCCGHSLDILYTSLFTSYCTIWHHEVWATENIVSQATKKCTLNVSNLQAWKERHSTQKRKTLSSSSIKLWPCKCYSLGQKHGLLKCNKQRGLILLMLRC